LFDYRPGDDLDVLIGNGLGGTSLINANVVIEPQPVVFRGPRWPRGIRRAAESGELARFGEKFLEMIHATDEGPKEGWPQKVKAMEKSGQHLGTPCTKLRLAVNFREFDNELNHVGVHQALCTQCGDCVTGCNVGAKNTLPMNYLPAAKSNGAHIFTGIEVRYLARAEGGYHIYFHSHEFGNIPQHLFAPCVVVSAGALGSTGILLNSQARGLPVSWRLGHHFSGNADQLSFGYNNDQRTDTLGFGAHLDERAQLTVGPTIMSMLDFRSAPAVEDRFIIEEGAVPRALTDALRKLGTVLEHLGGQDTDKGIQDKLGELGRAARDWVNYDPNGAANHSMLYLGMGHDGADGRVALNKTGEARVLWGAIPDRPIFGSISEKMYGMVEALGGTYIRNPRWNESLGKNLITVHPLGGCPMGDDVDSGVVNEFGEVFDAERGDTSVHKGLFVADGSVLPDSVGVNPLYTISLIAERIAAHIAEREDLAEPARVPEAAPYTPLSVGFEFSEEMTGFVTTSVTNAKTEKEYRDAAVKAQKEDSPLGFRLTMLIDDLKHFIEHEDHEARAEGVVDSKQFGPSMRVTRGLFNLFVNAAEPDTKNMLYRLRFVGKDAQRYLLDGFKIVRDDPGIDLWADNTTLYTSIRSGWSADGAILAQGVLHINVPGFLSLLGSMTVKNSPSLLETAKAKGDFGRFFLGSLWETYGVGGVEQQKSRAVGPK
jgi:cholesterol oxidase